MVKAIVFDCFGVLTTDGWLPLKQKLFGANKELFVRAGELNRLSDTGAISYLSFLDQVAKLAGLPVADIQHEIEHNVTNSLLFDFIKTLKPSYKVGLLSNAANNWLGELFSEQQIDLFEAVSLSCESGFVKPDQRAYKAIADLLNEPLSNCLLIDDQARYCEGARLAGMPAILYKNVDDLKNQLALHLQ